MGEGVSEDTCMLLFQSNMIIIVMKFWVGWNGFYMFLYSVSGGFWEKLIHTGNRDVLGLSPCLSELQSHG